MIFNLFKSKPTLKELIPKGYIDIHSHILPGIDDGAKNVTESVELVKKMKNLGFSKIIGTPHTYPGLYDNTNKTIKESFEKLKEINIQNINLDFSSEYMIDNSLIEKSKNRELLCLKDNYILVEMSYLHQPINLYEIIFELRVNGYIPILAHPERYYFFHNNFKAYLKLKKFGCLFQANLLSSTDYYGKEVRLVLDRLLKHKLIDFTGSDVHKINHIEGFEKKINLNNINAFKICLQKNKLFS